MHSKYQNIGRLRKLEDQSIVQPIFGFGITSKKLKNTFYFLAHCAQQYAKIQAYNIKITLAT